VRWFAGFELHRRRVRPPSSVAPTQLTPDAGQTTMNMLRNVFALSRRFERHCTLPTVSAEYRMVRHYNTKLSMDKFMEQLGERVVEARDEIEVAIENKDTVYFNDDKKIAVDLFDEVMEMFKKAKSESTVEQARELDKRVGLKLEELKALRAELEESDH
jgi:hypothetical protein